RLGVGLTDLGRDPATVADLVAVLLGPLADLLRLGGPAARGAPAPGDLPTTTTSGRADPWRECIPELASILRIQIDLVGDAVQRKRHRLFSVSSIDIGDEQDANLLRSEERRVGKEGGSVLWTTRCRGQGPGRAGEGG